MAESVASSGEVEMMEEVGGGELQQLLHFLSERNLSGRTLLDAAAPSERLAVRPPSGYSLGFV